MQSLPKNIEELIEKRERLREGKKYKEADELRGQIENMGYELADTEHKPEITKKDEYISPKESFLAIFGSGETAPSAVRTHTRVLESIGKDKPNIAILSTPAGFQPNVEVVCEEIAKFFEKSLQNFHPRVRVVYANTAEQCNDSVILSHLETADYIFAGPGSPTYMARIAKDSALLASIEKRVQQGASLALSSAAAIACSKFCLPVYEIYKAGFDLYWEEGLSLYANLFEETTIITHFNNTEGGKKLDTSHAWMGKERFATLLTLLPKKERVLGIDEHTALLYNLATKKQEVLGKGKVWRYTT